MGASKATRNTLLAKVRTRLDRFIATQDPAVVLATAAVGEVGDLLKTVPDPAADLEIMATAGFLHWFRYQVLPAGEDQEDLLTALMFFQRVYQALPEVIPEPLLVHLDPARTSAARARELLRRTEAAADPAALDEAVDLLQQAVAATPEDHPRLPVYLGDLDDALERRFELTGERTDIDAAVDVCRRAVAAVPVGHPDRAGALSNLGNALGLRFERGGDQADLDQAIEAGSAAEAAAGADHPARVQILANLGSNLVLRADRDGSEADVRAAVGYLGQAAELLSPGHPARPPVAANLAGALFARWNLGHDRADLAESIRLCQEALAAVPPGHPKRDGILLTLSQALHDRGVDLMAEYRGSADLAVLNAAVEAFTNAAAGLPVEHPIRRLILSALCAALTSRYERTGDRADLERAVAEGEQACADPALRTADALSNLSTALRRRYERDGRVADLDQAIDAGRQAVAMTKDAGPDLASALSNLGGVLQRHFERTGEIVILNEAIETFQRAVAADRDPVCLGNLGIALLTRFERDGAEADLRNAIEADREALQATPCGRPDRARRMISLSHALIASAGHSGTPGDLDEAIRLARDALAALPGDHADRGRYHNTLANGLMKRWERTESAADLEEAISEYRRAAVALPADHPDQAVMALNLGEALGKRFRTNRAQAAGVEVESEPPSLEPGSRGRVTDGPDLAAIVHFYNEAVNTPTPLDYGELVLSRLDQCTEEFFDGLDMLISYSRSHGQTAQTERLTSFKDYLRWAKAEAAERGVQELRNELIWGDAVDKIQEMASGLERREAMDQQFARLGEVIGRTHGRLRVQRLAQLATLLLERYMRSELPADLDECIRVQRLAAEAGTPDNTEHAAMLANLSSALQRRSEHRTEAGESATNDLNAAIDAGRQATRLTSPGDPLYVNRLAGLATLLLHRFDQQGRPADRDEAVRALEDALACGKASGIEATTIRAMLEVRQQQTRQLAFRQRLDRFIKEADEQLIIADDACDELLAALAEATVSPAARLDLRVLVDTVNFLIWRVTSVPQDQAIREMAIRQPVAAFLTEIENASDPAERERLMGRSAEVARTALTGLRELWHR